MYGPYFEITNWDCRSEWMLPERDDIERTFRNIDIYNRLNTRIKQLEKGKQPMKISNKGLKKALELHVKRMKMCETNRNIQNK